MNHDGNIKVTHIRAINRQVVSCVSGACVHILWGTFELLWSTYELLRTRIGSLIYFLEYWNWAFRFDHSTLPGRH